VVLRRSFVPRVARLGILIAVVATVLAQLQSASFGAGTLASWGVAIPVVVTATVIESLWETWDEHGLAKAAVQALVTLCVAVLIAAVLLAPSIRHFADTAPVHFAVACLLWTLMAACYKGLRLNELVRFAPAARQAPGVAT
jgi:Na+-translocating ferredoxin:NAD+ oxidoreductase RnfE subunit